MVKLSLITTKFQKHNIKTSLPKLLNYWVGRLGREPIMFIYTTKQVSVTEISDIKCDKCGLTTKNVNGQYEYIMLTGNWEDGVSVNKHICKTCATSMLSQFLT
jgi:hypothetical protein